MKKVLLSLFLFCLITLSVEAKDIISDVGKDLEMIVSEKEDLIVSDNLNWNKEGKQTIDYFSKIDSEIRQIDLYQEKETKLKEGIVYTKQINNFFNLANYRLSNNFYFLENGTYIVLATKELESYNNTPVVLCFKDDSLIWEYEYSQIGEGGFSSAVVENNKIYVLGFHKQVETYNLILVALSFDGLLQNEKIIIGNYDAFPISIYSTGYDLLFAWKSKSHSVGHYQDYSNPNQGIVFGQINYDLTNFSLQKYALDYENLEYQTNAYINGEFYVLAKSKELGTSYLVNVDYRFSQVLAQELDSSKSFKTITSFNNRIIGIIEFDTYFKMKVYDYNFNLKKDLFISKNIYGKDYKQFFLLQNESYLYIVLEVKDIVSGKMEYHFTSYNENFVEKNSFDFSFDTNEFINMKLGNNYFYFLGRENNVLNLEAKATIILKEEITEDEDYIYYDSYYLVNDQKLEKIEYFKIEFEELTTKKYINEQEDKYLRLYALSKIERKMKNNILDQTTYDTDKILNFNGKGYLNGLVIPNNYQIKEEGYYVFRQVALDGREQILYFTIQDLSLKDVASKSPVDNKTEYYVLEERQKEIQFQDSNVRFQSYQKTKYGIFIILFSLPIGVLGGIFLPKLIQRRKKDV